VGARCQGAANIVNVVNDLSVEPLAVANRLRPVLLKLNRELRREVHPLGVTGGQVSLLIQIRQHPGIGVRELATLEGISPAGMSGHIDRLERRALVTRTPDTADRRRQGVSVTPAGEKVLRAVKQRRTAWLAARLRRMSEEERARIEAAVEPLSRLLGEAT
jgi:DNA-binding MarR family transcriptional regulator